MKLIKIKEKLHTSRPLYITMIFLLLFAIIISIVVAVSIGTIAIPLKDVYSVLMYKIFSIGDPAIYGEGSIHDVVIFIRLPRLVLAVAVGMGLAVSGVVMQAIVKNPLADPYILGVSSGASLGATLAVMLGVGITFGSSYIGVMGCIGAFVVSILVLLLSNIGSRSNSVKLLLSGMALSSLCSAFSSFVVYFANDAEGMMSITYWLMGSLAGAKWGEIAIILPLIILCSLFFVSQYRILNLMLLGDEVSVTLGTNLQVHRNVYLLVSATMIGFIVYASGMIGFVGLMIPHIVRIFVGTDHKRLIPISALAGALLLIWADVLCRVIIPGNEIPIGILISMVGAPSFIYLMAKKTYGFGGTS